MNCLHSFRTENKLKSREKVFKNKDFYGIVMLSLKDNILQFNRYIESDKTPYIIYADLDSFIKNIDGYANNPKKSSAAKTSKHIP